MPHLIDDGHQDVPMERRVGPTLEDLAEEEERKELVRRVNTMMKKELLWRAKKLGYSPKRNEGEKEQEKEKENEDGEADIDELLNFIAEKTQQRVMERTRHLLLPKEALTMVPRHNDVRWIVLEMARFSKVKASTTAGIRFFFVLRLFICFLLLVSVYILLSFFFVFYLCAVFS